MISETKARRFVDYMCGFESVGGPGQDPSEKPISPELRDFQFPRDVADKIEELANAKG